MLPFTMLPYTMLPAPSKFSRYRGYDSRPRMLGSLIQVNFGMKHSKEKRSSEKKFWRKFFGFQSRMDSSHSSRLRFRLNEEEKEAI